MHAAQTRALASVPRCEQRRTLVAEGRSCAAGLAGVLVNVLALAADSHPDVSGCQIGRVRWEVRKELSPVVHVHHAWELVAAAEFSCAACSRPEP